MLESKFSRSSTNTGLKLMNNNTSLKDNIAFLMGQVSVLGISLQAALNHHPNREQIASDIRKSYEQCIARMTPTNAPDAFLSGMKKALDLYVLKQD